MKDRIPAILVVIILFTFTMIGLLIVQSDKYEDDIEVLREENKLLKQETSEQKKQLTENNNTIDWLQEAKCMDNSGIDIEALDDGYLINGKLYLEKEGYEVYE